jgi:hypothetical protein
VIAPREKAGFDTPYDVTVMDYSTDPDEIQVQRPGGFELYRNYYLTFNPGGSYSLRLAGDFAFQKDYRLPQGAICPLNTTVLPFDPCQRSSGSPAVPQTTTNQPTPSPNTLPTAAHGSQVCQACRTRSRRHHRWLR